MAEQSVTCWREAVWSAVASGTPRDTAFMCDPFLKKQHVVIDSFGEKQHVVFAQ